MKVKKIKVPYYKWVIISIVAEKQEDREAVVKEMKKHKMLSEDIENIEKMFDRESVEGAVCHYNDGKLLCVIITFPHKNTEGLVSTLIHEGRHAADRIIESVNLEGVESAAYLNEYISTEMIKDYIKDEANKP